MEKYKKSQKVDIIIMAVINTASLIFLFISLFSVMSNSRMDEIIDVDKLTGIILLNGIIGIVIYIILGVMWHYCKKGSIISRYIRNYHGSILYFKT